MTRRVLLAVSIVTLLLSATAPAAGLSGPSRDSTDIDIAYADDNSNLKFIDGDGNVVDTGKQARYVGGVADFDGDGDLDIVYSDPNKNLKYVDASGAGADVGVDANRVGGIADIDGDGDLDVAYTLSSVLRFTDSAGDITKLGFSVEDVGGVADFNGDGDPEILYRSNGDDIKYVDSGGGTDDTGVQGYYPGGGGDMDGDGNLEIVFVSTGFDVKYIDDDGSVVDTGVQAESIGGVGDVDGDGDLDIAYGTDTFDEELNYVDSSGNVVETGKDTNDIGGVADIDGDGLFLKPPSVDNSSADPAAITTTGDPVALSIPVYDSEFSKGDSVDVTFVFNGDTVATKTISSNQTVSADVTAQAGANSWYVTAVDSQGNSRTSQTFSVSGDFAAPEIESFDPADGEKASSYDGTVEVTVSDADLPDADELTVSISDGDETVGSQTLNSNGSATISYAPVPGQQDLSVSVTDAHGLSTTQSYQFLTPSELSVFYETEPKTPVNTSGTPLRIRFFGMSGDEVRTKRTSDGTVNLTGLPANERFVVTVAGNETQFTYRRIVINSIYETEQIYLLRKSQPSNRVVFELSDPTGQFPPEDTLLFVEKPIEKNNSTQYRTIAGDNFGATGRYPVTLETQSRYRLRIVSDGNERVLGAYQVTGAGIEELQVQRIQPAANERLSGAVYGAMDESGDLTVRYRGGNASSVSYQVRDQDGNVVVNETKTNAERFAHVHPLNSSEQYNVSYSVEGENGEEVRSGSFVTGGVDGVASRLNMDAQILSLLSWVTILMMIGLVVIVDAHLAPAAGTATASGLVVLGTVAIPAPILGVAGAVSALALFGGRA